MTILKKGIRRTPRNKTVIIGVRIPASERDDFRKLAFSQGTQMSVYARGLIRTELQRVGNRSA